MSEKLTSAFKLYKQAMKDNLSFSYRGPFVEDLTHRIIDITENTIADNQGLPKINRKVSFLLVECFQNIIKHGESVSEIQSQLEDEGLFHFKNSGHGFMINSINLVKSDEVEELVESVDLINSLDKDSLKAMYKKQLQENELSEKGGAGLGLIEIARKSGQKLDYEIEKLDDKISFFHQQISFIPSDPEHFNENAIPKTREHYHLLRDSDILLQYKGDFSQKSILPLLNIVENNIGKTEEERLAAKKVGHILIETLQNISKHGLENHGATDGIFIIGRKEGEIFILAANVIAHGQRPDLESRLEYLVSLSQDNLETIHKERIMRSVDLLDKSKSGLGLIEIAKTSSQKLEYQFDVLDEGTTFFSLHVSV